jgi:hypothetical protein
VKLLVAILIVLAAGLGVLALMPLLVVSLPLALTVGCFLIWLLPMLIIASSDKTTGSEKLAWILAIIFLSWFAWIFYFLLAPLKRKPGYETYRYHG